MKTVYFSCLSTITSEEKRNKMYCYYCYNVTRYVLYTIVKLLKKRVLSEDTGAEGHIHFYI